MTKHLNSVAGRLSLRPPQRESLEILARVAEIVPLSKETDVARALEIIRSEWPSVSDFERDFPSLCFALATGVGKTRLMGAFISYLYLQHGLRHFFVLAPNLTIYNKLIADFTPGHAKYVFQGIAELAQDPPEIITGDNYESARGVRGAGTAFGERAIYVNIFNISKINTEVRGGNAPRIKRLSEYIGESYFDYLAGLDDLVLLMDESHRYRASAGVRAINELKPILGLELTATPQIERGARVERFRNIIYDYPLARALADGFVKQPAVATRENFDAAGYDAAALERLKLEDGIRVHESVRTELETYATENGVRRVKPFMLVIARDTGHAGELQSLMESPEFFDGAYKGRVITVHSNISGAEKDETVERLLRVESAEEPAEVVIHVNMLKEGWDVTNLYTIVPLRAANARTLVEQSIGRGLRLPYGRRTGIKAVDRLTIVAHDRFQEIVDEANRPDSPIRLEQVLIGKDVPTEKSASVVIEAYPSVVAKGGVGRATADGNGGQRQLVFETLREQQIASATLAVLPKFEHVSHSKELLSPEVRAEIVNAVNSAVAPEQQEIEGITGTFDVASVVDKALKILVENSIDVPRITFVTAGNVKSGFREFDLDMSAIHVQPVSDAILVQGLVDNERDRLTDSAVVVTERLEDHLVSALSGYPDVSYDDNAELLYKLSGQMVAHLRSYLGSDDAVENALRHHVRMLAEAMHSQMEQHRWEQNSSPEPRVMKGFTQLRPVAFTATGGEPARPFRQPVDERQYIRGLRFTGFRKCLYPEQRFDSDTERRFATILEHDPSVLKWFRPAKGQIEIYYSSDRAYEPDFIVETTDHKLLCETKRESEMTDAIVLAKAAAAARWCECATTHATTFGGKPWRYLMVPESAVTAAATMSGLLATYSAT